jgi:hypothetical protein
MLNVYQGMYRVFFPNFTIIAVEESIVNGLYRLRITEQLFIVFHITTMVKRVFTGDTRI